MRKSNTIIIPSEKDGDGLFTGIRIGDEIVDGGHYGMVGVQSGVVMWGMPMDGDIMQVRCRECGRMRDMFGDCKYCGAMQ